MILSEAIGVGIGMIGQEEIDLINILQATLKAMVLAIGNLPIPPDFILIDGPHGLSIFPSRKNPSEKEINSATPSLRPPLSPR